jgi:membrane associated rhomboid family serine protease
MVAERERAHTISFIEALFSRKSPFTYIFLGLNLGVFLLMWMAGGMSVTSTDHSVLIGFGAKVNSLINDQQQYWRLVSAIFIHIGFAHFILNNYALWILGQQIEQIYGSSRFVLIYLVSGIAGSIASYVFNAEAVSAGASGAIFGLFGTMGTFAFRYRKEIPASIRRDITRRIIPVIAINLIFGFSVSVVDNAAHIGGLLSGVVLALIVPYKRPTETSTSIVWRALQIISLVIIMATFVEAFRHYDGPRPSFSNLTSNPEARVREEIRRINEADRLLLESINSFRTVLQDRNSAADSTSALEAAKAGLKELEGFRPQDERFQLYSTRLTEVLKDQQRLIERYNADNRSDTQRYLADQEAIIDKAADYQLIERTGNDAK